MRQEPRAYPDPADDAHHCAAPIAEAADMPARNQSAPANGRGGDTRQGMGLAPEIRSRMGVRTGVIRIRPRPSRASS